MVGVEGIYILKHCISERGVGLNDMVVVYDRSYVCSETYYYLYYTGGYGRGNN